MHDSPEPVDASAAAEALSHVPTVTVVGSLLVVDAIDIGRRTATQVNAHRRLMVELCHRYPQAASAGSLDELLASLPLDAFDGGPDVTELPTLVDVLTLTRADVDVEQLEARP